jgi:phage gp46-like protein
LATYLTEGSLLPFPELGSASGTYFSTRARFYGTNGSVIPFPAFGAASGTYLNNGIRFYGTAGALLPFPNFNNASGIYFRNGLRGYGTTGIDMFRVGERIFQVADHTAEIFLYPRIPIYQQPRESKHRLYEGDIDLLFGLGTGQLTVLNNDLDRDGGLKTAILISLLSDKRASDFEALPDVSATMRGWWADALQPDQIGSKLWLLERSKLDSRTVELAEHYTRDALQWMIDDGVANKVNVQATILSNETLRILISIHRTKDLVSSYFYNWNKQIIGKGT